MASGRQKNRREMTGTSAPAGAFSRNWRTVRVLAAWLTIWSSTIAASEDEGSIIESVGAGYGAYYACTGIEVMGLPIDDIFNMELSTKRDARFAELIIEPGLGGDTHRAVAGAEVRTASYTPGFGCVIDDPDAADTLETRNLLSADWASESKEPEPWPKFLVDTSPGGLPPYFDQQRFERTIDRVWQTGSSDARNTRALLVYVRGHLLAERYENGIDRTTALGGQSMAKTVAALWVGHQIDSGAMSLEDPLRLHDDNLQSIDLTVEDALAMRTGSPLSISQTERMLFAEPSSVRYVSERMSGTRATRAFEYNNGATVLLSSHLRRLAGNDEIYWRQPFEHLFQPLGIKRVEFATDADGSFLASGMLYAAAIDWLRIGTLLARRGLWNDERIVSADFIDKMRTPSDASGRYGFHVWLHADPGSKRPADLIELRGFGGNRMSVFPDADIVLLRLAHDFDESWDQMSMFIDPVVHSLNEMVGPPG